MKLKEQYELVSLAGDSLLIPLGDEGVRFHGVVVLNDESAFILEKLKQEQSMDSLVQALLDEYEIDEATAETAIRDLLRQLDEYGITETKGC
ncbi:MAG: PqqD family protein [Clostridia bacterium]|nr:PqqD family protein [Clostridia bacterium]